MIGWEMVSVSPQRPNKRYSEGGGDAKGSDCKIEQEHGEGRTDTICNKTEDSKGKNSTKLEARRKARSKDGR